MTFGGYYKARASGWTMFSPAKISAGIATCRAVHGSLAERRGKDSKHTREIFGGRYPHEGGEHLGINFAGNTKLNLKGQMRWDKTNNY